MNTKLEEFNARAKSLKKENQNFYRKLKSRPPDDLDFLFLELHEEVFAQTDCLTCANCCKTTAPIFYEKDIERAARGLRLKPGEFTEKYLRVDEDKDYIPKTIPCPFLKEDNACSIYDFRPAACREYPHTNRKRMRQILELTFRNTLVCPAVLKITEKLKATLKQHP
ncbi:MAG: YkgJ family cysteine cluster protein [Bacteroidia bacterium]|jgi:hypothetical protein|nr:YkgJ family cysteine cluster protein [Bacteroidia bacterium]